MGCNCGRKKKPVSNVNIIKTSEPKIEAISREVPKTNGNDSLRILDICSKCVYSKRTEQEKRNKIHKCHRLNMDIKTIARKVGTKCPINKF